MGLEKSDNYFIIEAKSSPTSVIEMSGNDVFKDVDAISKYLVRQLSFYSYIKILFGNGAVFILNFYADIIICIGIRSYNDI